jgi:hypothetical protein
MDRPCSIVSYAAEDEVEVGGVLTKAGYSLENELAWHALGDMENNFSTVGNQRTDATAALVEKIINGIDAVLMAECFSGGIDPEKPEAPQTMVKAVERFFSRLRKKSPYRAICRVSIEDSSSSCRESVIGTAFCIDFDGFCRYWADSGQSPGVTTPRPPAASAAGSGCRPWQ